MCEPCAISETVEDLDLREGVFSGTILWGPNQIDGIVNESFINGYKVTVVDRCGHPLTLDGDVSALYFPKQVGKFEPSCCSGDAYAATWSLTLPEGYSHFMVVAYSNVWGDQDAGSLVEIVDLVNGTTDAASSGGGYYIQRAGVSSGVQRAITASMAVGGIGLATLLISVV